MAKHSGSAFVSHTNTPPLTLAISVLLDGETCHHRSSTCVRRGFTPVWEHSRTPSVPLHCLSRGLPPEEPDTAGRGRRQRSRSTGLRTGGATGDPRRIPARSGCSRERWQAPSRYRGLAPPRAITSRRGGTRRDSSRGKTPWGG